MLAPRADMGTAPNYHCFLNKHATAYPLSASPSSIAWPWSTRSWWPTRSASPCSGGRSGPPTPGSLRTGTSPASFYLFLDVLIYAFD
uniref:Uncharacterized protein n=1 Tax=Arundo donax TaxID=35708 RepID=A0A0A8ZQX4_ARUDO